MSKMVLPISDLKPLRALLSDPPGDSHIASYNFIIESEYSFDLTEGEIFDFIVDFVNNNSSLPSLKYVTGHFTNISRGEVVKYLNELAEMPDMPIGDLKDHLNRLYERKMNADFASLMQKTMAIYKHGEVVDGQERKGRKDAYNTLLGGLGELEPRSKHREVGSLQTDISGIWDVYLDCKANPDQAYGLLSGFPQIDEALLGGKPGEFHIVLGYTGHGKSLFTQNYLYNVSYIQKQDSVLFSLEMNKSQMMYRLVGIHSAHEKFNRIHPPISTKRLKTGTLTESEEDFMVEYVIPDLLDESNGYGTLLVEYPGDRFTASSVRTKMMALERDYDIKMVAVDYPGLVTPEDGQKFSDFNNNLNQILKSLKQLSLTYKNGQGVFVLCPFQSSREGYKKAVQNEGRYELTALSHANEAERAADVVYSVFLDDERASPEMFVCNLKNRDGAFFKPFYLSAIFEACYLGDLKQDPELDTGAMVWDDDF